MNFKATLDRIENGIAVLLIRPERTTQIKIPLFFLPEGSEEGDILNIDITKDMPETENAKARASTLLNNLKSKN
ncbi:DUF3006 domain-containing protein [Methanomethylovorans sp.]|uniref:DUF3006 domain-containing protein n=1 Tax=Methanomethylovorans sp. TaxID=2758717 RepID=UPI002FDEDA81